MVDTGQYDARRIVPSTDQEANRAFNNFRERLNQYLEETK